MLPTVSCGRPLLRDFSGGLLALLLFCAAMPAYSSIIRVPQDRPDIDSAIKNAKGGDEIIVSPGVYAGRLNVQSLALNIHSTNPANPAVTEATVIQGDPRSSDPVVRLGTTPQTASRLAGFKIIGGAGSAIVGGVSTSVVEYCHIVDNAGGQHYKQTFGDDRTYGGAFFQCNARIRHNLIEGNSAEMGAGLAECHGLIESNIIARNRLIDAGGRGARGAALYNCQAVIRGNTIVDNAIVRQVGTSTRWAGGGLVYCLGPITNNIIWVTRTGLNPEYATCSIPNYSCLKGWTSGGKGNIASDPRLVNAQFDETPAPHAWPAQDWRLRPDSPAIDAGMTTTGLISDYYGQTRGKVWRASGAIGDGTHVDMGACEFIPGALTLWVPASSEPAMAGRQLAVRWALGASVTPVRFSLSLVRGAQTVASLGSITTTAGHTTFESAGLYLVNLPPPLPTASNYQVKGASLSGLPIQGVSAPFIINKLNGISAAVWSHYW